MRTRSTRSPLLPVAALAALAAPSPGAPAPLSPRDPAPQDPLPEAPAPEAPEQDAPEGPETPRPTPPRPGGSAAPSEDAFRMGSPPRLAEGLAEEDMWPAATAEGWAQPCLVRWQRTFDDALRVARAERRPILVAVNMDGEIASEHWAGVRYRQPETAAWMNRYACVIASVYRHTTRDHDEEGRRVECPRFGTVTCGEHIEAERQLYERYFDGRRISPRHIVLDLEEKETYDVYFSWDTDSVSETFRRGLEGWPEPIEPAEPTLTGLAKSADVEDREALERAYREGERETKRAILETLVRDRAVDQVEVLRSAIFGLDLELAALARRALARCETDGALELMAEVLKTPLEDEDREMLLAAVRRLADGSNQARTLAALHGGLSLRSRHLSADLAAAAEEYEASAERADVEARARVAEERPGDPEARLAFAEGLLERAEETEDPLYADLLFEDARSAALSAERLGVGGPRLDAVLAVAAGELGDRATARQRAVAAVEGGLLLNGEATGFTPRSRARLLELFGQARQRAIRTAYRAGEEWPPEWLSDVNAAYSTLMEGDGLRVATLVDHHDFLRWIGASPRASAVLDEALERFPGSPELHERLRARLLWEGGPKGLERGYAEWLAEGEEGDPDADTESETESAPARRAWYAGYASLIAAEHHRRRAEPDAALAAYARSIERFDRDALRHPEDRDGTDHYVALALAGRARVLLERGALAEATDALSASLERRPATANALDGLGLTPVMTSKMLKARLADAGEEGLLARLQAALDALAPELLEPLPFELGIPVDRPGASR